MIPTETMLSSFVTTSTLRDDDNKEVEDDDCDEPIDEIVVNPVVS